MVAILKQVTEIFQLYSGSSLYMTLFLCALLYLWLTEQEKGKKIILVYVSTVLVVLFFFPLFSYVMLKFILGEEGYYRLLWFFPVSIIVAYSAVKLVSHQAKPLRKAVIALMACLILLAGGNYAYDNPTFERAENAYHIPQTVVDICEEIMPEPGGEWVRAVMPHELISYVRQYTAMIYMPYGRPVLINRWNLGHPMYETMEAEVIDAALLTEQAREYGCHYIVLRDSRAMDGSLEKEDFHLVSTVDGYDIYLDEHNNRGIEKEN